MMAHPLGPGASKPTVESMDQIPMAFVILNPDLEYQSTVQMAVPRVMLTQSLITPELEMVAAAFWTQAQATLQAMLNHWKAQYLHLRSTNGQGPREGGTNGE